jgi:putative MATE family efflux protein
MNAQTETAPIAPPAASLALSTRTLALLHDPILPTLLRLAWPNILVMVAQAASGLIETWFVGKLGTDALAGMALVFPGVMLMQMISGGAMGGGISSAIARALGARRHDDADALVLHALLINLALGLLCSITVLMCGPSLYAALGGRGASLAAALAYSNVVFLGTPLLWLMNALVSVIRGTGNMLVPALVICGGVALLIPLSPCLIFGIGPFPALGVAGGGAALVTFYAIGTAVLAAYVLSGRNIVRLRLAPLRWSMFREILRVGAVASLTSVQTNVTVALTTALAAGFGPAVVAGYGTGARLEYLLVPLVFGLGGPLVAMVGTNIGAGQRARALRAAWTGAALAFALTEAVGLAAALHPNGWLGLFDHDPAMLASGAAYLRVVGPFYGCFGLGLALYFASQGAGKLLWPVVAGMLRLLIAAGGGAIALRETGSLTWLFAALAIGLAAYGATIVAAIAGGAWFPRTPVRSRIIPVRSRIIIDSRAS